jgi:acetolactate synthase-1/2/3 large subunit
MMNLAVGVAESYADGVPLLAIIGQPPTILEGRGAFQDSSGKNGTANAVALWSSITKYTAKVTDPKEIWQILKAAFQAIFDKKPGPAALLIPKEIFSSCVPARPQNFINLLKIKNESSVELSIVQKLHAQLQKAAAPLIIVGKFVRYSVSGENIIKIAEQFNGKIATTLADVSGGVQEDNRYLGQVGICGHREAHYFLNNIADLVLVLDDDLTVISTTDILKKLSELPLIYIGNNATNAKKIVDINMAIEKSVNVVIDELLNIILHSPDNIKSKSIGTVKPPSKINAPPTLTTHACLEYIQPYLSKFNYCFFDAGDCVSIAAHYLRFPAHVKTVTSLGMGNMGYAFPAVIGVQLGAKQHQNSIVFSGDGGFLISGLEIHTAVEYSLPILFVIFNNNKHGMCETRQKLFFQNRIIAANYKKVNIAESIKALCDSRQLWSLCAADLVQLITGLQDYFTNHFSKTGIIEIKINGDELPPMIPFLRVKKGE